jgi:hypothetical protein
MAGQKKPATVAGNKTKEVFKSFDTYFVYRPMGQFL